jgi:hydrogenase expression/formation protein HypC
MCLAIPAEVTALLDGDMARVSLEGVTKTISLALVDDVKVGDFVVLHVGFALAVLSPQEAALTLEAMREAGLIEVAPA